MFRYSVKKHLIVLNLFSVSIIKILFMEFITVKGSQNLNLIQNMSTKWNQQLSRHVFWKVIFGTEHSKTNQLQKTTVYKINELNEQSRLTIKYLHWNMQIEI